MLKKMCDLNLNCWYSEYFLLYRSPFIIFTAIYKNVKIHMTKRINFSVFDWQVQQQQNTFTPIVGRIVCDDNNFFNLSIGSQPII